MTEEPYTFYHNTTCLYERPVSVLFQYYARVVSAETECVAKGVFDVAFLRFVESEVEFRVDLGIELLAVYGGGYDTFGKRHYAGERLYGACRTEQMAGHRLGRVDVHVVGMVAEHRHYTCYLGHVAYGGRCAVSIDVVYVFGFEACVFYGVHHGLAGTRAVG